MKAFLMYPNRDFDLGAELPTQEAELTQDLGLDVLFDAMALGDPFLRDVARKAVLSSLEDPREIVYRQRVLRDCIEQSTVVREIYAIAVEAIERERKIWRSFLPSPDSVLHGATEVLDGFMPLLRRLRSIADAHGGQFQSDGFARFFQMVRTELDDEYLQCVDDHLKRLRFRHGVLVSARLGKGNKGVDYVLRKPRQFKRGWWRWLPFRGSSPLTLVIAPRDEAGTQALSELRRRGINLTANAVAQAGDHILSFFGMVRAELGFYIACLNLLSQLIAKGEPVCFPESLAGERPMLSGRGLYDVCLSLRMRGRVVGNDLDADDMRLVVITGANQGGKSTFLRSVGLAQLMMQCGMVVAAERFRANTCAGVFTHFKREEDPTMESGKLDEELGRMSKIADRVTPHGMVLFNESFAATNEREGAEIASGIIRALLDANVKVFFVTHSFELAHYWYGEERDVGRFLRADRLADGTRTFRLVEGEPLPTSHGEDLYRRIFEEGEGVAPVTLRA
ncbi:MAG TPA: DNA mismatch repair protein MutS [Chloroflexota bacterium]|nr:DNA mismatch repair protein MutS [Chloroflexota bacterium]